jgi:asparagine synthase (glutamine-hydrolysing)
MNSLLKHRGPDSDGIYFDDGFCMGHTRLSILDVSNNADQPMISSDGRFMIAYNGEIYNFQELAALLLSEFHIQLKTTSDTEVLVNLIQCLGIQQALEKLEGMFAFCLYDLKEKQVYLARDRFGEKPLYFFCKKNCLYFSSEMKPLINSLKDKLTNNFNSLDHFLK